MPCSSHQWERPLALGAAGPAVGHETRLKSARSSQVSFHLTTAPQKAPHSTSSVLPEWSPVPSPPAFLPGPRTQTVRRPDAPKLSGPLERRASGSTQPGVSWAPRRSPHPRLKPRGCRQLSDPRGHSPVGKWVFRGPGGLCPTAGPQPGHTQLRRTHGQIKLAQQLSSSLDSPTPAHPLEGNKEVEPKCIKNYVGSPK